MARQCVHAFVRSLERERQRERERERERVCVYQPLIFYQMTLLHGQSNDVSNNPLCAGVFFFKMNCMIRFMLKLY